jgi:DNA topoisomerase-1
VESPNKAKTLRGLLGRRFEVLATVGHFCDLPEREMGVDIENGFRPTYVYAPDRQQVVAQLRGLKARYPREAIIVASDADREGEAIGWHIARTIGLKPDEVQRAEFHEITPAGVKRALEQLRPLDLGLVAAQEARRILDRLVGYSVSPVVRDRLHNERDVSAGRVQSVALRVVVEREMAIRAFVPEEYWRIRVEYPWPGAPKRQWHAEFVGHGPAQSPTPLKLATEADARAIADALAQAPHGITHVEQKESLRHPSAPFITATMLQRASNRLRMAPEETTRHAKQLFEAGLITYIRTDDPSVSPEFQEETRQYLRARYGPDIVPAKAKRYKAKAASGAQGAHECIRPTQLDDPRAAGLSGRTLALYNLIRETFLASQCKPARYDVTEAWLEAPAPQPLLLKATGRVLRDPGFLALFGAEAEDEDDAATPEQSPLPALAVGDRHTPAGVTPSQHFTRPPERFTEASLIKYLEARGIGRPSTYAAMVAKIRQRAFVETVAQRYLSPTSKGERVDAELRAYFAPIIQENFTAQLETRLDHIAARQEQWRDFLAEFWGTLTPLLDTARAAPRVAHRPSAPSERPLVNPSHEALERPTTTRRRRTSNTLGTNDSATGSPLQPDAAARQGADETAPRPSAARAKRRPRTSTASSGSPATPRAPRKGTTKSTRPRSSDAAPANLPPCPRCREAFLRPITSKKDGRVYLVCGRDQVGHRLCGFIMAEADLANPPCPLCQAPTRPLPGGGFGCVRWAKTGGPASCAGRLSGTSVPGSKQNQPPDSP